MAYLLAVQMAERLEALDKVRPDDLLVNVLPALLVALDLRGGAKRAAGRVALVEELRWLRWVLFLL